MTTLSFTEVSGPGRITYHEALVQVGADFNLHIEREGTGNITVELSTVQGAAYAKVADEFAQMVFDRDYDAIVYPKYLRIRSWSKPVVGYITEAE